MAADPGAGIPSQGERMSLDWFHLLDEPYLALQVAAPPLSGIRRDIHGLRILLTRAKIENNTSSAKYNLILVFIEPH